MPLLMKPFKRRQAPRCRGGTTAVRVRQAAEARRRSRRTSPDAAESGGGKGARNASQALAATGWELRTFAIGRSLAKLERRRQSVDESPAGLPAWAVGAG
jgi:hypothetical protein